ncbi:hypothetical protein F5Y18DRAFT_378634 [Xylariaceae sp. FL1019]|nr:hypothetical protein F5Y18DRAFT_378634 [Xylariaceae sp. FL1019]
MEQHTQHSDVVAKPRYPAQYDASTRTITSRDESGKEFTIVLPPGPMKSAQPNNMEYEDDDGVQHSIYLPQGTMKTAWDHLENKRWDELAKFEPYTDQGYTEDDFNKNEQSDTLASDSTETKATEVRTENR